MSGDAKSEAAWAVPDNEAQTAAEIADRRNLFSIKTMDGKFLPNDCTTGVFTLKIPPTFPGFNGNDCEAIMVLVFRGN